MKKLLLVSILFLASCSYFDHEVARLENPKNKHEYISLSKDQGHCPASTQELKIVLDSGTTLGCWMLAGDTVLARTDDGAMFMIPKDALTWK